MNKENGNSEEEQNLKFVHLIEEKQVILSKFQLPEIKKQKSDAILQLFPKWAEISGKTLNVISFKKKLHNMKSRTTLAAGADKRVLCDWQKKLLELSGSNVTENIKESGNVDCEIIVRQPKNKEARTSPNADRKTIEMSESSSSSNPDDVLVTGKRKANEYLKTLESDVTMFMDEKQLKRCLILKKMKLVDLQIYRLENENIAVALGDIDFIE